MKHLIAGLTLIVTLCLPLDVCVGQFMFLDGNRDGRTSSEDAVGKTSNIVDVWLQTDANADGTPARDDSKELGDMTLNSYELILRAVGGKVRFGEFKNAQPSMYLSLPTGSSETEMYVGFAGPEILPPGKYLLGAVTFDVLEGDPRLVVAAECTLNPRAQTSFGSRYAGVDGWNTLRLWAPIDRNRDGSLGEAADDTDNRGMPPGDWRDTGGLRAASSQIPKESAGTKASKFSVAMRGSGSGRDLSLSISTARSGRMRVVLFDVQGRSVRTLVDNIFWPVGRREVKIDTGTPRLRSGVYFYKVWSEGDELSGRFVVLN